MQNFMTYWQYQSQARPKELSKQGRVLEAAIQAAATVISSLKDSLNEWDGKVGDGDCGSTVSFIFGTFPLSCFIFGTFPLSCAFLTLYLTWACINFVDAQRCNSYFGRHETLVSLFVNLNSSCTALYVGFRFLKKI